MSQEKRANEDGWTIPGDSKIWVYDHRVSRGGYLVEPCLRKITPEDRHREHLLLGGQQSGFHKRRTEDKNDGLYDLLQYFAGFLDGDGTISYPTLLSVGVGQSSIYDGPPSVLVLFQQFFGGRISKQFESRAGRKPEIGIKPAYIWTVTGASALRMVRLLHPHLILKKNQRELVLENYKKNVNRSRMLFNKGGQPQLFKKSLQLLHHRAAYAKAPINPSMIGILWLSGFIDAEGSVGLQHKGAAAFLEIAQLSCPTLLLEIQKKIGGRVGGSRSTKQSHPTKLRYFGSEAVEILERVCPWLIVKRDQAEFVIEHLRHRPNSKGTFRSNTERQKVRDLLANERIRSMKRYHSEIGGHTKDQQKEPNATPGVPCKTAIVVAGVEAGNPADVPAASETLVGSGTAVAGLAVAFVGVAVVLPNKKQKRNECLRKERI